MGAAVNPEPGGRGGATPRTPSSGKSGGRRGTRGTGGEESQRRAVRRAMSMAIWVWPAFTLLDIFMARALYPATPAWHFISQRVAVEATLVGAHRLARRQDASVALLIAAHNVSFLLATISISWMALDFGGLNSAYVHGLTIAVLVRAVTVPAPWQRSMRALCPMALSFPVVMGIAAVWSPEVRAAWLSPASLLTFASHYVFVLSSVVVGALSGHLVWAAQQQVYQARKLGRYRLEAPIGEGGMSEVWLAWDEALRRGVALKLLRTADAPDGAAVRRFEQEAQAASKLCDPHTIRIFDFGASDDGIYYIAMEHLRGMDLAALVQGHGPMPVARALRFAAQACRSLREAHEAGIIHRDIKPQNLFATRAGDDHDYLKLLDFGIARVIAAEEEGAHLTRTGVIRGTPAYMAPEVCRGERADARADVYALGATLFFLLTGAPPFEGPSSGHVLAAHMTQPPPRVGARRGEPVPEPVEQLVSRCLAKDPGARFQTARELGDALDALVDPAGWTAQDAQRFWLVERPAMLERMEAPTE